MAKFYITTTLPYVNAEPHIGFGLEITEADVLARFHRLIGDEVIFNTGTDEHGSKIYQKALDAGLAPQAYVDEYAAKFADLRAQLNLSYTHFIRTTAPHHQAAAQEFWRRVQANGDIYKQTYRLKYCVGCELEKTESELVAGRCPLHPQQELENREEENYFFRFSKYQLALLDYYQQHPDFVVPAEKMREIQSFVAGGLQDFSISRLRSKMPWGVPVPDDDDHVMYVWFDALVNYISTLGWPNETVNGEYQQFWPGVQVAGKDNLRQQAAMWQAMLLSAGLPLSRQILLNGFISIGGQKMSKSLGNVIAPIDMQTRYGTEATRYLLLSLGAFRGDMDVTWERLDQIYTAQLVNGLGNLCSRIAKMAEKSGAVYPRPSQPALDVQYVQLLVAADLTAALDLIAQTVNSTDAWLAQNKPWQLSGPTQQELLQIAVDKIRWIAQHLEPFMPDTSAYLQSHFGHEKITSMTPLFPRLTDKK